MLTGSVSQDLRMQLVREFQEEKYRIMVASPQVAGTGLTLTAARDVIYYHNQFSLPMRLQSEDRTHRIGQIGTVTYTDLVGIDSVDEHILDSLVSKRDIAAMLTGDVLKSWLSS